METEGRLRMKKVSILITVFLMFALCACAEQKPEDIGTTTVYVRNDGSIIATYVEDFSQSYYDMAELQSDTEANITSYNASNGEGKVEMTFFAVEGNVAKMQMEFADAKTYTDYIGEDVFCGTVAEALEQGYELKFSLHNPANADDVIGEHELLAMQDSNIIIVENALRVRSESKILYMSSDAKYIDEYEVDGYDNPDATVIVY